MDASQSNASGWQQRLLAELKRDKKKTAMLAVLAVVGVFVACGLVLKKPMPRAARAAVPADPQQHPDKTASWRRPQRPTGRTRRAEYLASLDRDIERDLFKPRRECFPFRAGKNTVTVPAVKTGPGWFDKMTEYVMEKWQAHAEELARIRNIRALAAALSLTSTMLGDPPAAVINGQVLRVGQTINGFRLESISSTRCTLSKDAVRVDLHMQTRQ